MSTNPDWLDIKLGGFCKEVLKQIDENPYLNWMDIEELREQLDNCAKNADASPEDSVAFMRRELIPLRQQIRLKTGKDLLIG